MTDDPRKWVQIANGIRSRIDAGELKPDDRVSIVGEALPWGVARETAAQAIRALAAEGHLRRYSGHGYVVVGWCPDCLYQYASDAHKTTCAGSAPGQQVTVT